MGLTPVTACDDDYLNLASGAGLDWLQSLKQFFINVSYHILVASLTLMTVLNRAIRVRLATSI